MRSTHPFEASREVMWHSSTAKSPQIARRKSLNTCSSALNARSWLPVFRDLSRELSAWEIETSPKRLTNEMNAEFASSRTGCSPS